MNKQRKLYPNFPTSMFSLGVFALSSLLIAPAPAQATDFTLSDSAIMSLDYNLQDYYGPPITSTITSEQDIPGTGVQFNIHFPSTNSLDCFRFQVSDSTHGAGTLAGLNVSTYSNFVLKFTVLSIDGSTSASPFIEVGALIGPYEAAQWAFHPVITSLAGSYPSTGISTISVTSATISDIGFYTEEWPSWEWPAGPHDISLLVQPADGLIELPEPTTWALVTLGSAALFASRRSRRRPS